MKKYYYLVVVLILVFIIAAVFYNKTSSKPISPLILSDFENTNTEVAEKIEIKVDVEKEIFPVVAKYFSEKNEDDCTNGLVKWYLKNKNNEAITLSLTCKIQDWAASIIKTIRLNPNENKVVFFSPFSNQLLNNNTIASTTILLAAKMDDKTIFEETRNLKIRASDDMVWSLHYPYDTEQLIASWVTPNDETVETILSQAKERRFFNRKLDGYQSSDLLEQIRIIYNTVRENGVSYVSSTVSFGDVGWAQRVRLPKESISQKSANCIDEAVLLASLFENIGLEPLIILLPGHAFVGVRKSPNSREIIFIETTLVGRNKLNSILTLERTFDAAVREGNAEYNNAVQINPNSVRIIDIKQARRMGIYPLE